MSDFVDPFPESPFRRLFGQFLLYWGANAASGIAALLSVVVFTRLLSPTEFGWVATANSIVAMLAVVLGLNLPHAVPRYHFEDGAETPRFLSSLLVFVTITVAIATAGIACVADRLAAWLDLPRLLVYAVAPVAGAQVWLLILERHYVAQQQGFYASALISAGAYGALVFGALGVVLSDVDRYGYKFYAEALYKLLLAAGVVWTIRQISLRWLPRWRDLRYAFAYALPRVPYGLSALALVQIDRVMINQIAGASEAAFFSVALSVGMMNGIVVGAISSTMIADYFASMKVRNYRHVDATNEKFLAVMCFTAVGVAMFGDWIVHLIADVQYRSAAAYVHLIAVAFMFHGLASVYGRVFDYTKATWVLSAVTAGCAVLKVLLNIPLIRIYGSVGAVYSTLAAFVFLACGLWAAGVLVAKQHVTSLARLLMVVLPAACVAIVARWASPDHSISFEGLFNRVATVSVYGLFLLFFWRRRSGSSLP